MFFVAPASTNIPKSAPPTRNDAPGSVGRRTMIEPEGWWSQATLDGMRTEFDCGDWDSDDLLMASLDMVHDFHWQSHTMSHLARDDLGETDCNMEDGGECLSRKADARQAGGRLGGP